MADSPAVAAIREAKPSTPEELLRAVSLLIALDRMDLAEGYLEHLASPEPGRGSQGSAPRAVRQRADDPTFASKALSPLGRRVRAFGAAGGPSTATDPQRLSRLVTVG